ncbi:type II secretion system protein N [Pseudomonas protegens]|uniref:type II secretion system protein N n=1 Tax=Pseudomonas protegens TaxID=380021 RepID=UPI001A932926|nr:type II secretion system protein N [Pseudomonas protegens]
MSALRPSLRAGLLVGALSFLAAWLAWLAYGSWQFRQSLNPASQQAPAVVPAAPRSQPDPQAIARLFGVQLQEHPSDLPRVPLSLLASLVAAHPEQSRALIESPEGSRFYGIGEPLPGGGSLRQIGTGQVRVQRFGEELILSLPQHATPLLTPQAEDAAAAQPHPQPGSGSLLQPSVQSPGAS